MDEDDEDRKDEEMIPVGDIKLEIPLNLKDEEQDASEAGEVALPYQSKRVTIFNSEVYAENDEQLSHLKLTRHIQRNHPTDENGEFYSGRESIGSLPCCGAGGKRKSAKQGGKENDDDEFIRVTRIQQQIGLGPTLFLMVTKALGWLFFVLTMINIPVFAFYRNGNADNSQIAGFYGNL